MEKVSVIIPVYNTERYLEECLDSICGQTYKNIEIILINDGSTDNSLKICESYKSKDNRIIIINKENTGVSDSRNIGIEKSTGKYIFFLDSDDYLEKNTIENMVKKANGYNMVICGMNIKYINTLKTSNLKYRTIDNNKCIEDVVNNMQIGGFAWNKLFEKEIISLNGLKFNKNISMCEDLLFVVNYLKNSKNILILDENLYYYRIRKSSLTTNKNSKRLKSIIYVYKEIYDYFVKNNFDLIKLKYYIINLYFSNNNSEERKFIKNSFKFNYFFTLFNIIFNKNVNLKDKIIIFFNSISPRIVLKIRKYREKEYQYFE